MVGTPVHCLQQLLVTSGVLLPANPGSCKNTIFFPLNVVVVIPPKFSTQNIFSAALIVMEIMNNGFKTKNLFSVQ